jgi:hypothetical protein
MLKDVPIPGVFAKKTGHEVSMAWKKVLWQGLTPLALS